MPTRWCNGRMLWQIGWLVMGLSVALPAAAQQTIFNVPSADVTPKGRLFVQHESQFKPVGKDTFLSNTEYGAVGIGHNTELDVTVYNVNAPASRAVAVGAGFKSAIPFTLPGVSPERELKWTVGTQFPVAVQGRGGVGNWTYSHVSTRLPRLNTRLTAGVSVGTRQIFGRNAVAFIGGVEQPVGKKVTVVADWFSGTHSLGLLIVGGSVALPHDTTLYMGYQLPNTERSGRQGIVLELSKLLF
jgi:hypothetical protein